MPESVEELTIEAASHLKRGGVNKTKARDLPEQLRRLEFGNFVPAAAEHLPDSLEAFVFDSRTHRPFLGDFGQRLSRRRL